MSYVPEIPWNDSCASGLIATYFGLCDDLWVERVLQQLNRVAEFLTTAAGSGGPSGCATGTPATTALSVDRARDTPSRVGNPFLAIRVMAYGIFPMSRSSPQTGLWGHYYVACFSDPQ